MPSQREPHIGKLPGDVFLQVADLLDPLSLTRLSQVCKSVNELLQPTVAKAARAHALPDKKQFYDPRFVTNPNGTIRILPNYGRAPPERLVDAIRQGRANAVKSYLKAGVDPDSYCLYGTRMLNSAIYNVKFEIVDLFLAHGADHSLSNLTNSVTPLKQAAQVTGLSANQCMVKRLLDASADPSPQGTIHEVARHCHVNTLRLLVRHGADLRQRDQNDSCVLHCMIPDMEKLTYILSEAKDLLSARNNLNETPLFSAICTDNEEFALALCTAYINTDPNLLNLHSTLGGTVLHCAISHRMEQLSFTLIKSGIQLGQFGRHGTELCYAARFESVATTIHLLGAGADPNVRDARMYSPLYTAVSLLNLNLAKALVEYGNAHVNSPGNRGLPPLQLALRIGYAPMTEYLKSKV